MLIKFLFAVVAVVTLGLMFAPDVHAGDDPAATGQTVSVGTRRTDRTRDDSIAPVDVIYPEDFATVGYTSLTQILAALVPGFTFPQPALAGGTDHARPASFRGLSPDQMLVLLDGKRRNPSAQFHRGDTMGRDALGVDLSVIPLGAVKRIEVLRDGASAQYGTDAMAGVINIVLKDSTEGGSLTATFGQYRTHLKGVPKFAGFNAISSSEFELFERAEIAVDDGDGDTLTLSGHGGFTLFDEGFVDISVDYRDQDVTNRSGNDPRAFYPALPNGDWDPREQFVDRRNHIYGNPDQSDLNMLVNFGLPVSEGIDFYGNVGYSSRNADSYDLYRLPVADANIPEIYPNGFLPELQADVEDRYYTFGLRGHHWGWDWDFSMNQGENEIDWELGQSLNASIGPGSPREFQVGNFEGRHQMFNLDLFRFLDVGFLGRPLAVAGGVEYRSNEYENERGDRASTFLGTYPADDGSFRPGGSQGFYGVRDADDFDNDIVTLAAYLEVEADLTDDLAAQVAVRVDDAEDNTEVTAKVAARWSITERWTLRGSVSRNVHTPSAAQAYFWSTQQAYVDAGAVLESGVYPTEGSAVAQALGADSLDSETSLNLLGGLRFQASDTLYFELDVYQIEVDDQIVMSELLAGPEVDAILAAAGIGVPKQVQYLHNGLDVRTRGADFQAGYDWDSRWGVVQFSAGLNLNDRSVTGEASRPPELVGLGSDFQMVSTAWQNQLEEWTPDTKLHLGARWQGQRLGLDLRAVRYGKVTDFGERPEDDLELDPTWLIDLNARYALTGATTMAVGIHNMLDEYPDVRPRNMPDQPLNNVLPYSAYSPYGFNGRYAYLRLSVDFSTN